MAKFVIKVGKSDEYDEENRVDTERETQATVTLDVRKTMGGDLAIYDHEDIDIIVSAKFFYPAFLVGIVYSFSLLLRAVYFYKKIILIAVFFFCSTFKLLYMHICVFRER